MNEKARVPLTRRHGADPDDYHTQDPDMDGGMGGGRERPRFAQGRTGLHLLHRQRERLTEERVIVGNQDRVAQAPLVTRRPAAACSR